MALRVDSIKFVPDSGGGKLILWVAGREPTYAEELPGFDWRVSAWWDDEDRFCGLSHEEPKRLPRDLPKMRKAALPLVDFPEAGLFSVHPAEVLAWAYQKHFPQPA